MRIDFLCPQGPQPTEMTGLAEFRRKLPAAWKGYANFNMRNPKRRAQDREIDVVLITPDRLILVDLKHVKGRIESRNGTWYKGDESLGRSAAHKIRDAAKVFAELVRREVRQIPGAPPVEAAVVFTHDQVDFSGLDQNEKERCFTLADFIRVGNEADFRKAFTAMSNFGGAQSLNGGAYFQALQRLFTNERLIEPRRARYHGFVPTGTGQPEFSHPLYEEFPCHEEADPNYTGLLRLWRFDEDPDTFALEEERRPVAERERAVLGFIRAHDPVFYDNYVMRCVAHDREFPLRHSEVFERHPDLARLTRFSGTLTDLDRDRRLELARIFLDRVAALHRLRIAHRDLDRHSVWVDERRSNVVLSNFGASHYPERKTIGAKRAKVLAGGFRVPEDVGNGAMGSPFQQDVFLAGAMVWTLLTGERLPELDRVPLWTSTTLKVGSHDVPPELKSWFEAVLSLDAPDRPVDAVEAADRFADTLHRAEKASLERQLDRFRKEIDPVTDHEAVTNGWIRKKPYRVFRARRDGDDKDATVLVKSWPERYLGDRRRSSARLIDFFARAERLEALAAAWAPRIRNACLCMDGLLLVQDWIEGERLSPEIAAAWPEDELRQFLAGLVGAVEELHKAGLAHGDLKPDNVLVVTETVGPSGRGSRRPVLLDLLDYAPEAAGERATPAYCPAQGADDPTLRDRFALTRIALELAEARPSTTTLVDALRTAAERCGSGEEPWSTLKPLRQALIERMRAGHERDETEPVHIEVDFRSPAFTGQMLADNDRFHVVAQTGQRRVEVYGFDQKVVLELDPADGRPQKAFVASVDPREANWAVKHRLFSFPGEVRVAHSPISRFSGMDQLLARVQERARRLEDGKEAVEATNPTEIAHSSAFPNPAEESSEVGPPPPAKLSSTEARDEAITGSDAQMASIPSIRTLPDAQEVPTKQPWRFPVVRFWNETISVEEAIQPELMLTETPQETIEPGVVILRCTESTGANLGDDVESGDAGASVTVTWNGDRVGDVDSERTKGGAITLRNARNYRRLRPGDTLRLQNTGSLSSFQRRSKAVARILQGRGQLPNLVSYFDPEARLKPDVLAGEIPAGALDRYGLNEEQEEAFLHLWRHGPLGLLQGPPGTGKTLFIAAFVHWALNEGQMRNVLVLSQSHEAVNEVAERILKVAGGLGGDIDLLRVGEHEKLSPTLRRYHSQAVQDRYRELFRAEMKDRIAVPAKRLGLDPGFVREAFEIEATYGPLIRQMALARRDIAEDADDDAVESAHVRLRSLNASFHRRVSEETMTFEEGVPEEIYADLHDETARRHHVFDPDARRRLSRLYDLSRDWTSALRTRGRNLEEFLARSRNLVCGTCVGIGRRGIRIDRGVFDLVVIDEAARCTASELAVGMQSGKRVLLVGDHRQLPPLYGHDLIRTVADRLEVPHRKELERSDFERAFGSVYGRAVARTLKRQYRMASEIHDLVSDTFYPAEGLIRERPEPLDLYRHLPAPFDRQVLWLDTGGAGGSEEEAGTSFTNRREALVIVEALRRLGGCRPFFDGLGALSLKENEPLIGVICTYAQQAELLDDLILSSDVPRDLRALVKVDTVDAYQGKESRIVMVSLVRNNHERDMGHVRVRNRINVALSRAMDRLLIFGAKRMFALGNNPLRPILSTLDETGRVRLASDLMRG